jgi:hypothetical protein
MQQPWSPEQSLVSFHSLQATVATRAVQLPLSAAHVSPSLGAALPLPAVSVGVGAVSAGFDLLPHAIANTTLRASRVARMG